MKLKNKKTGEIVENILEAASKLNNGKNTFTLAELNEEWEDYEETKGYWFIDSLGEVHKHTKDSQMLDIAQTAVEDWHLNIGNYFKTKEEAEKAVEKLKAWKRLKDKGLELNHWKESPLRLKPSCFAITGHIDIDHEVRANLDLLFGGEE